MYQLFQKGLHPGNRRMVFQAIFPKDRVQAGEGQPCAAGFILPNGNAQGQFQGYALVCCHESGAYLGRTEYKYGGRAERKSGISSILSMVKFGEYRDVPFLKGCFQAGYCLRRRELAFQEEETVVVVSGGQKVAVGACYPAAQIGEIHTFLIAHKGDADQLGGIGKAAQEG